jgi:Tol biopolymer transport system component
VSISGLPLEPAAPEVLPVSDGDASSPAADVVEPRTRSRAIYIVGGVIAVGAVAGIGSLVVVGLRWFHPPDRPVTSPSEYEQLTDFGDSAVAPSLSPNGDMVTFIRGGNAFNAFLSRGQIYVKLLPNGEARQLTSNANLKFAPVFTPDSSRVAYTEVSRSGDVTSWDTWTVPVLGGEPTRLLPNASGLVWLGDQRIMFSEFKGKGGHLGIVSANEARGEELEIYFPAHERGMAHYSYPSPDGKSVLVAEMDPSGTFQQCRVVPFDGSSTGRLVGPQGTCTSAAWSPDGKWMYLGARIAEHSHLWRQAFPAGPPEQMTFGPTEEEGVAVAADGRSLITSIGRRKSAIWIHDASGERPLSSEGFAHAPRFSHDGHRLYYLLRQSPESPSSELRSIDLASGRVDRVLPGVTVAEHTNLDRDYDISRDEQEVVYATKQPNGKSRIWLARLDRRTPPREIGRDGEYVSFGGDDEVFFVSIEKKSSFLTRMKKDGAGRAHVSEISPIYARSGVSPDGEWAVLYSPAAGPDSPPGTVAVPIHGGTPKRICTGLCWAWWSDDRKLLYVSIFDPSSPERTLVFPLVSGRMVPDFPPSGMDLPANQFAVAGARVIGQFRVFPGPDPSTYAFVRTEPQRNLYRIPIH